jgi:hypothetical protein
MKRFPTLLLVILIVALAAGALVLFQSALKQAASQPEVAPPSQAANPSEAAPPGGPESDGAETLPAESPEAAVQAGPPPVLAAVIGLLPGENLALYSQAGGQGDLAGELPAWTANLAVTGEAVSVNGEDWSPVASAGLNGWVQSVHLAQQSGQAPDALAEIALRAVWALREQDYPTLGELAHPDGLRFAPYSYLSESDQIFPPDQVAFLPAMSRLFNWGVYDGSGEAIETSLFNYYSRFIFDVDFTNPEAIGFNSRLSGGSRINNIADVYPDGQVVEYYFSGFDPQYSGMDWRSLQLVFRPVEGSFKLAAIVHDEWGP